MDYTIDFAVLCDRGKVRAKNQDNYWCGGKFLESKNDGLKKPLHASATNHNAAALIVFDGMGGEVHGEIAAYLAAKTFNEIYYRTDVGAADQFLAQACLDMNDAICKYREEKRVGVMGTTMAALLFNEDGVYACNVGDSKIFRLSDGQLGQISYDHVVAVPGKNKPSLSQCLGISPEDFIIEPYITKTGYAPGDRFLICSDGLTDMVAEREIGHILAQGASCLACGQTLMNTALANGGIDNITVIVCEVKGAS